MPRMCVTVGGRRDFATASAHGSAWSMPVPVVRKPETLPEISVRDPGSDNSRRMLYAAPWRMTEACHSLTVR
jgi:hypothetical protein